MFQLITRDFLVDCFNLFNAFLFQFILYRNPLRKNYLAPMDSKGKRLCLLKRLDWIIVNWLNHYL